MKNYSLSNNKGMTLIELMVAAALFIIVIMITAQAFNTVLTKAKIIDKSEESNIEGVVGLEIFRHDLEQGGFGLFTDADVPLPSYLEAKAGIEAVNYNDSPGGIPRAFVARNNLTPGDDVVLSGSDYIAIKATSVGTSPASQKWTYISGLGTSKVWGANDFTTSDFLIAVRQSYKSGELHRKLIYDPASTTTFAKGYQVTATSYADPFGPPSDAVQYYYYGIDTINPRAPFNRTDYVVKRNSATPKNCAPGAGVLYKTTMNQSDGDFAEIPVLDCVADMQVVFGWSTADPAGINADAFSNADASTVSAAGAWPPKFTDPTDIRKHLKLIKVYILAQDGGKDLSYTNPNANTSTPAPTGEASLSARTTPINLSNSNYQNYRWKWYQIIVKPKNLL